MIWLPSKQLIYFQDNFRVNKFRSLIWPKHVLWFANHFSGCLNEFDFGKQDVSFPAAVS